MDNIKKQKARLRFAPSPTGFVHIGNLRSALFGYFLAKSQNGDFIFRLEDTDQKREVAGALDALLDIFNWVGVDFDEGPHIGGPFEPYVQSQRQEIYNKHIQELLEKDGAYHCFCSEDRINEMRKEQEAMKVAPRYDRKCRSLKKEEVKEKIKQGEKFVIRQKMPLEGSVEVFDEIRGKISFPADDLDDQVLIKSNGIPTYQFANVIDDHLMEISHVTRGDEWLPSFPKNILLYQTFKWEAPKFIHLPLILNKSGGKLSKRQGDVYVENYRQNGYLPEAIINFCALLGWHPKHDKEILSLDEIKKEFSVSGIGSSPAVFDSEKLDYLNGYYIRQKSNEDLGKLCLPYLTEAGYEVDLGLATKLAVITKDRMKKLKDVVELSSFIFSLPDYETDLLLWKKLTQTEIKEILELEYTFLENISEDNWTLNYLQESIFQFIKDREGKNGDYLWPLRVALCGQKNSPSPFEIAWTLGKKESLTRIKLAISKLA